MLAVLAFAFSILLCDANSYAAKKTTASLAFGSQTYIAVNDTDTVKLKNKVKKAAYSFSSKNKKVATVNKKGIVKGISVGKTKIVVIQKLNKKSKKIATLTVYVRKTVLAGDVDPNVYISNQPGYEKGNTYFNPDNFIAFKNRKAKYTVKSSDTKRLSLTSDGKIKNVTGTGKVKVSIKETYKKKTRNVCTVYAHISTPKFADKKNISIYKYETYDIVFNTYNIGQYFVNISKNATTMNPNDIAGSVKNNDDVLRMTQDTKGNLEGRLKGISAGKRFVSLYLYDYNKKKYITKPFANFTVTVKTVDNASKLKVDFENDYDDDENGSSYDKNTNTLTLSDHKFKFLDIFTTPYNYTGEVTATSSNPDVVKIISTTNRCASNDIYTYEKDVTTERLALYTLASGSSKITLKANGAETSFNVVVKAQKYNTSSDVYLDVVLDTPVPYAYDNDDYYDDNEYANYKGFTVKSSDESIVSSKEAFAYNPYVISDSICAMKLHLNGNVKNGPVTLSVYYKGKIVGSVTINIAKK